jgi:hypothetical protein
MSYRTVFAACALLAAVVAVGLQDTKKSTSTSIWNWTEENRKYDYALLYGNGTMHCFGSWNTDDVKKIGGQGERMIVKKRDDGSLYLITDRATVDSAKKALEPVMDLGKQQGALGKRQGQLGKEMGKLGAQMGEIGGEMGKLSAQLGDIMRDSMKEDTRVSAERRRADYDRKMADLHKRMQDLGKQQGVLGGKQGELGKQQGELGRRQGEASKKADEQIVKLIDQAFEKGLAKSIK